MNLLIRLTGRALAVAVFATGSAALAGPGHDHGDAPAAGHGTAAPRFAATSDLFELVGILDGRKLALYLDRTEDNSPVKGASLELEVAGSKVVVTEGAEGEFQGELPALPGPGVLPVTAMVVAGGESDLLAGELEVHGPEVASAERIPSAWPRYAPWAAGVAAGAALLAAAVAFARVRAARDGGAA